MSELTPTQRIRLLELAEKIARDYVDDDPKEQTLDDRMDTIESVYDDLVARATGSSGTETSAFDDSAPDENEQLP